MTLPTLSHLIGLVAALYLVALIGDEVAAILRKSA